MHLHPEKVTSTCSQHCAERDPHSSDMLAGACESVRAAADACRLSLKVLRRLSAFEQTLCRQSLRGVATLGQMVPEVQTWRAVSPWP